MHDVVGWAMVESTSMNSVFDPVTQGLTAFGVLADAMASSTVLATRRQIRLAALLDSSRRRSRLFGERLAGMSFSSDSLIRLDRLPVVSKIELIERFDDWLADPEVTLSQLRELTRDPGRIGESFLGKYLVWESSGSSHQSCVFVQDTKTLAVYDALETLRRGTPRLLPSLLLGGLRVQRIAFIGVTNGHFATTVSLHRLRHLNPIMSHALRCFSILQPVSDLLAELNRFAPTVIATYPSVAMQLVNESDRGRLRFLPDEVWLGGETLGRAARLTIETAWHCTVRNSYGASEFMAIGWECRPGRMHANTDWVILEPVDDKGQPVPEGQLSHTTLLTNLANHVQPLIRYDLGDQMAWVCERCECGSSLPLIEVVGRRDDVLVMAGEQGRSVLLLPLALTSLIEDEAAVFDFQLCQRDAHTLTLRLGPQIVDIAAVFSRCCSLLKAYAAQQGAANIDVVMEEHPALPRGKSGKWKKVVAASATFDDVVA